MPASVKSAQILVVDDAPLTLEIIKRNLNAVGHNVFTALNVEDALRLLETESVDLLITDLKMPRASGLDLVRYVRENLHDTEVMMITGYATIEGAVEAVKAGAEEYLTKPFTDEELLNAVQRALKILSARRAAESAPPEVGGLRALGLIGKSPAMLPVYRAIAKAAATSATVLISGESGTGKELIARAIHYTSRRSSAPFIAVNCAGIPETLLESELFGHVKGAFTGAHETRAGFFIAADGGALFFDEIGEMPLAIQAKLLRVLQDREVTMVGATKSRAVDVRIIAAANRNLAASVQLGQFRKDLFFRLDVIPIIVPPLRERGEDCLMLAHHFLEKYSALNNRKPLKLTDGVIRALQEYNWPGNVRELENLIQRLVIMTDGNTLRISDLPVAMRFSIHRKGGAVRTLNEVVNDHIRTVLESVGGNKSRAAAILGIDRSTLRARLEAMNINEDDGGAGIG